MCGFILSHCCRSVKRRKVVVMRCFRCDWGMTEMDAVHVPLTVLEVMA